MLCRPGRGRGFAGAVLLCLGLCLPVLGATAHAQDLELAYSPILTIDQERLLTETNLGAEIARELEARAEALASENRRIEAELIAEERALTEKRKTMSAAEFRPLAEAFDEKVQRIRAEQDAKERELARAREEQRARFVQRIVPLLGQLAAERGAVAILDRRVVFLAAESIDITDEAIARINAALARDDAGAADAQSGPEGGAAGDAANGVEGASPEAGAPEASDEGSE